MTSSILSTHVPPTFDLGLLLVSNVNPLDKSCLAGETAEEYLAAVARENAQSLIAEIWKLPTERVQEAVVAALPKRTTILPREKPVPKPKPLTKWEQYAQLKGIQKKKNERMVWDDTASDWRPLWGYKKANDPSAAWAIEVPANSDPYEDQFEKLKKDKKERVAKNELLRLKNISRSLKVSNKIPSVGVLPATGNQEPSELKKSLLVAKRSDASLGQFSETVRKEKLKGSVGRKQKFLPNTGSKAAETEMQMMVLKELDESRAKFNAEAAVNKLQQEKEEKRHKRKLGNSNDNDGDDDDKEHKKPKRAGQKEGPSRRLNIRNTKFKKYGKKASFGGGGGKKNKMGGGMRGKTLGKKKR